MKRNFPPDDESADLKRLEKEIIDQRLQEIYKQTGPTRTVLNTNKGTYLKQFDHIRLESGCRQLEGFSQHSSALKYHHLQPIQALYLLESRQIVVYYDELPLSIAGAYKLFLRDKCDFHKYVVFSHLNRNGYFCLPHQPVIASQDLPSTNELDILADGGGGAQSDSSCNQTESNKFTQPLVSRLDIKDKTPAQIMESLVQYGPKLCNSSSYSFYDRSLISFDAYKRETFNRNKPKKGCESDGKPDYHVIVQDKNCTSLPETTINDTTVLGGGAARDCNKYLFAIIDADSSLSFIQCDTLTDRDLG